MTLAVPVITPRIYRLFDEGLIRAVYGSAPIGTNSIRQNDKDSIIGFRNYGRNEWRYAQMIHLGIEPLWSQTTNVDLRKHWLFRSLRRTEPGLRALDAEFNVVSDITNVDRTNPVNKIVTLSLTDARTGQIPTNAADLGRAYRWMLGDATTEVRPVGGTHDTDFSVDHYIEAVVDDIQEAP